MKTNNKLLNNFLLALKSKGKSQNTITSYETDIVQFLNYIRESKHIEVSIDTFDKDIFNSIEYTDLEFYMNYLTGKDKPDSESTRARKTTSIKEFFKYLKKIKTINDNVAMDLETPKIPERKPVYLDLNESKKLLNSVYKNDFRNKERDYAILTLFLNCGLRREEMTLIDIDHIKGDILTVIGKGNKEREVILTPACLSAIELYMLIRPKTEERALFLNERKQRMGCGAIYNLVKKYLGESKLDTEKYSTHTLRHSAASLMYKYGGDIKALQEMLGHTNLNTTKIYTHIDKEQQRKVANSNPLSNI